MSKSLVLSLYDILTDDLIAIDIFQISLHYNCQCSYQQAVVNLFKKKRGVKEGFLNRASDKYDVSSMIEPDYNPLRVHPCQRAVCRSSSSVTCASCCACCCSSSQCRFSGRFSTSRARAGRCRRHRWTSASYASGPAGTGCA